MAEVDQLRCVRIAVRHALRQCGVAGISGRGLSEYRGQHKDAAHFQVHPVQGVPPIDGPGRAPGRPIHGLEAAQEVQGVRIT